MALGWSTWGLGPGKPDEDRQLKSVRYLTKEGLRREKVEQEVKAKEKKEKQAQKQRCTARTSSGKRCSVMVTKPKTRCHYHD